MWTTFPPADTNTSKPSFILFCRLHEAQHDSTMMTTMTAQLKIEKITKKSH